MNKEQEDLPIESLPTDYADAFEADKKDNKKQLKEVSEDPKANYDRAMSDYEESLKKDEEQNKEEMKEISKDYTFDRDKTLTEYADFLKKDEEQNKEEMKEIPDDYKNNYNQAIKDKENYKKEDDDKNELIADHRSGFIRKDEDGGAVEAVRSEVLEKEIVDEKKEEDIEPFQEKNEKKNEVRLEKEANEEKKEPTVSEKIKEAVDNLRSLSNRKDSLLAQKERQKELAKKMGIKGENDSQVEKELEEVDGEYQEALEIVKVLTGKSEEEIMEEYLDKKREVLENTPEEKVEKINEKIDKIEEVLKEKEQVLSPEKKSLSEKMFERIGIKDKRAQLLIKAALVGSMIALPVAGVAVGGIYGLGLGQFILGQGFLPAAFGDMMNLGVAAAGGGVMSKLLREARELISKEKSSNVSSDPSVVEQPEIEIVSEKISSQDEKPINTIPEKEKKSAEINSDVSWVAPTSPDNKG
ncbi:MAG: hypothetical protein WA091_02100, partial [Minisyncoccales bacterium]